MLCWKNYKGGRQAATGEVLLVSLVGYIFRRWRGELDVGIFAF